MEQRVGGRGSGLELRPPCGPSEALARHSPAHPGSRAALGGLALRPHSHPAGDTDGQKTLPPAPGAPGTRRQARDAVSYLFSFVPRGATWASGSRASGETLGGSEHRCDPQVGGPAPARCPSTAPSSSARATSTAPRVLPAARVPLELCRRRLAQGGPGGERQVRGWPRGVGLSPPHTCPSLTRSPRSPLSPWKIECDITTRDHTSTPQVTGRNEGHGVQLDYGGSWRD